MNFVYILFSFLSAALTFQLAPYKSMGSVRASSLVILLFVGVVVGLKLDFQIMDFVFGGSFVGMASTQRFNRLKVWTASLLFPFLFIQANGVGSSIGGTAGASAFLAISFIFILFLIITKLSHCLRRYIYIRS